MPVGLVNSEMPSSVSAVRLTSAKRTRSSTWLLGRACTCRRLTTSSLRSTNAVARLTAFSPSSLVETRPDNTTFRPLLVTCTDSFGSISFICAPSRSTSRPTEMSYRRTAPARSHTNIEIVPGVLPCSSSWLFDVTIASAMSGLVSDTRMIGAPISSTVDRPVTICTGIAGVSITALAAAAAAFVVGCVATCARRVPGCRTATTRIQIAIFLFICMLLSAPLPSRVCLRE